MRKKIILIEDDMDACLLFRDVLSHAGYDVQHFFEGSCLLNGGHADADLYILDNCLPRIDGIALTKYLKIKDGTSKIPVLVISGNPMVSKKAKRAGAAAFVCKPFEKSHFLDVVRQVLCDERYKHFDVRRRQIVKHG